MYQSVETAHSVVFILSGVLMHLAHSPHSLPKTLVKLLCKSPCYANEFLFFATRYFRQQQVGIKHVSSAVQFIVCSNNTRPLCHYTFQETFNSLYQALVKKFIRIRRQLVCHRVSINGRHSVHCVGPYSSKMEAQLSLRGICRNYQLTGAQLGAKRIPRGTRAATQGSWGPELLLPGHRGWRATAAACIFKRERNV